MRSKCTGECSECSPICVLHVPVELGGAAAKPPPERRKSGGGKSTTEEDTVEYAVESDPELREEGGGKWGKPLFAYNKTGVLKLKIPDSRGISSWRNKKYAGVAHDMVVEGEPALQVDKNRFLTRPLEKDDRETHDLNNEVQDRLGSHVLYWMAKRIPKKSPAISNPLIQLIADVYGYHFAGTRVVWV